MANITFPKTSEVNNSAYCNFYKSNTDFFEYIYKMLKHKFNIPTKCLSMTPHNEFEQKGKDINLICPAGSGNCSYKYYCQKAIKEEKTEEFLIQGKFFTIIPILLNSSGCGTIVTDKKLSFNNNRVEQIVDFFKYSYQRYWIYKASIQYYGSDDSIQIVGNHLDLIDIQKKIENSANSDMPILITGETGTGKELWARSIQLCSGRREKPFIPVNCSYYNNDNLAVSNLFGHKKGSFTGANENYKGVFHQSNGGTIFLDEIGELSANVQKLLLRTLDRGEIQILGETAPRKVNVRIISATNVDLADEVKKGRFRKDLFYRIKGLHIKILPLRQRGTEDIKQLASHFLCELNGIITKYGCRA